MKITYTQEKIDKIFCYSSIQTREKIDRLLEIDASQYTNLGKESTKSEKAEVKRNSKYIYKTIKKIDNSLGSMFLKHLD